MLGAGLLVALALVGTRLARTGEARQQRAAAPLAPRAAVAPVASTLVVDVVGAVRRPGVYRVREGSRIEDAVRKAGGATRAADVSLVNLAAPLADGMQVVVPRRLTAAGPGSAAAQPQSAASGSSAARVSLSVATVEQLDELPGIGPVTAQKIVDWRTAHGPFASVDALDDVPGIGQTRIEQLRDLVTP